ncbi:MAG: hypothetical protein NVS3B25_24710 [Hymenobacter sp.]
MRGLICRIALAGALALLAAQPAAAQLLGNPLRQVLRQDSAGLGRVLARPDSYRLQILYTRIRRDAAGRPHFRSYGYRLRPRAYFYPASTVKLAAAALALEKLRALSAQHPGLGPESAMLTDSAFAGQTRVRRDTSSATGRPSVANYVRKALLVSDNDAFNRLYEFVGPAELNAGLARLGLRRSRLLHRLSVGDQEPASRHTNPVVFYSDTAATQLLYRQPAAFYPGAWPRTGLRGEHLGHAYLKGEQRVAGPLDFRQKNAFSLPDLQRLLRTVLFPEAALPARRLRLAPDDYALLRGPGAAAPHQPAPPLRRRALPRYLRQVFAGRGWAGAAAAGGAGVQQNRPGVRLSYRQRLHRGLRPGRRVPAQRGSVRECGRGAQRR